MDDKGEQEKVPAPSPGGNKLVPFAALDNCEPTTSRFSINDRWRCRKWMVSLLHTWTATAGCHHGKARQFIQQDKVRTAATFSVDLKSGTSRPDWRIQEGRNRVGQTTEATVAEGMKGNTSGYAGAETTKIATAEGAN
jgi:hypothetical protein